ncbi:MAG: hypothetical protein A2V77_10645 [Anaeromyxobacter sp. RBG_16_69_14]|nr:MAG: hypothetical protein A2V77_10645 [Anaeromyxobacter sp. RBG_16_69_14]
MDSTGQGMRGVITGRDVLRYSITILRLWGPSCYLRLLRAMMTHRTCTFLEVINEGDRYPS